jgi:aspartate/tyrosine/aromatic aminotransferase
MSAVIILALSHFLRQGNLAMFDHLPTAPADPILGLSQAFRADPRSHKIDLTVGVYKDESGATPILKSVKEAEKRLLEKETTKGYLAIEGLPEFTRAIAELALQNAVPLERTATVQSPGGTGACRVAADFIGRHFPGTRIWLSNPTWVNHQSIFEAAGLKALVHPYLAADKLSLDLSAMLETLKKEAKPGDLICLHACCHNPTGVDPDAKAWQQIAEVTSSVGILPLVDFAYQGFGDGLVEDTVGVRALLQKHEELLICSSLSKNFGLYSERVGAMTLVAKSAAAATAAMSQLKAAVRCNYSNPPRHGASVVATVLGDAELRRQWEAEVDGMRQRIHTMREKFVDAMSKLTDKRDFRFLLKQKGMFSYSGLTPMQVDWLKQNKAIYIVGSGRINVAGMSEKNLPILCEAIAESLNP